MRKSQDEFSDEEILNQEKETVLAQAHNDYGEVLSNEINQYLNLVNDSFAVVVSGDERFQSDLKSGLNYYKNQGYRYGEYSESIDDLIITALVLTNNKTIFNEQFLRERISDLLPFNPEIGESFKLMGNYICRLVKYYFINW